MLAANMHYGTVYIKAHTVQAARKLGVKISDIIGTLAHACLQCGYWYYICYEGRSVLVCRKEVDDIKLGFRGLPLSTPRAWIRDRWCNRHTHSLHCYKFPLIVPIFHYP